MQVSTRGFFDRAQAQLGALGARADQLNTQIATGKRLLAPSDDAVGWQRLQGVTRAIAGDAAFLGNVKLAQGILAQSDTVMKAMTDRLQRASELAIQAGNGTLDAAARAAIATELDGIGAALGQLAATTDSRGAPLFGSAAPIPIGEGQSVETSVPAERVLGDYAEVLATLSVALRGEDSLGDAPGDAAAALKELGTQVSSAQAAVGARAVRVDFQFGMLQQAAIEQEAQRSGIEDVDPTVAITELQKTLTVLQATQASFSKLSSLSLFDYIR